MAIHELKILNIYERIFLKKAKFKFTSSKSVLPSYVNQMFTFRPFNETLQSLRSTGALDFYTPRPQTKLNLFKSSHLEQGLRTVSYSICQVLVFINRHNPTMNLVEEKQRGLIPSGLQSWPLQPIEHFSNTTSVAPPPAAPAGCRPLYLLHLLDLSFTIRAPNGGCILQFRAYQNFVCNLFSTPRCECQVPSMET